MKKVVFLFMVCCAIAMSLMSCHKEAELTPEQEKTIAVRKLYYERVLGQWFYEEQGETTYYYVAYNFKPKGQLETHEKVAVRKRINGGATATYSDWEVKNRYHNKRKMGFRLERRVWRDVSFYIRGRR